MASARRIETVISPDILDTIGKTFKFRHGKGVAEWLKNSLDSYLRLVSSGLETRVGAWPVLINMIDGDKTHAGPSLAVIDFGGTNLSAIKDFFLRWGDTSAATHGRKAGNARVTGGHGNGGKFYMREMWKEGARFCSWRDRKFTSLVVVKSEPRYTGYWELEDSKEENWQTALGLALPEKEGLQGSQKIIEHLKRFNADIFRELDKGKRGFTVVVGRRAEQVWSTNDVVKGRRWDHQKLLDEIRSSSQAKRPIRECSISVLVNSACVLERLVPEEIANDPDWPSREIVLPGRVVGVSSQRAGNLRLSKSEHQLVGKLKEYNVIAVLDGDGNPIASYPISELPVSNSTLASFLRGELSLAFDHVESLIENDRERLVKGRRTQEILEWVGLRISELLAEIEETERAKERQSELERASPLNDALNNHARQFLQEIQSEIMVDFIEDPEGGGAGQEGTGQGHHGGSGKAGRGPGTGGGRGSGGTREIDGETSRSKKPKYPEVLISGVDHDPSDPEGNTKFLTKSHPPLWQDDSDKRNNVYWINTEHPFAKQTLERGGSQGHAFKAHQLYMFRDVVQREALRMLQKREAEIALDRMETELDEYSNRFLSQLPYALMEDLLGQSANKQHDKKSQRRVRKRA